MRASIACFCLLALAAIVACDAQRPCAGAAPGTVCSGTVDRVPKRRCIKPIEPSDPTQCSPGLLTFLSQIVNVASTSPKNTCAQVDCCDDASGQSVECANVRLGCVAEAKLCVGGAIGSLLASLLGPLDIVLDKATGSATGNLPITVTPVVPPPVGRK